MRRFGTRVSRRPRWASSLPVADFFSINAACGLAPAKPQAAWNPRPLMEYLAEGSPQTTITDAQAGDLIDRLLAQLRAQRPLRRVLLLPPDYSRLESGAGPLTCMLYSRLSETAEVVVMPTLGTHRPMPDDKRESMYPGIPASAFRVHDWRNDITMRGEVPADFVRL